MRALRLAALGLALAALPAPATASAAALPLDVLAAVPAEIRPQVEAELGMEGPRPDGRARFELTTRKGLQLTVTAADGIVAVHVGRSVGNALERLFEEGLAMTSYVARGTVTSRRIEASFGELGRIAVRFRPGERARKSARRGCRGPRFASRFGVFVGSIRLRGEGGRFDVRARRAKGSMRSSRRLRCATSRFDPDPLSRGRAVRESLGPTGVLDAGWRAGLAGTELAAVRFGDGAIVVALSEANLGGVARFQGAIGFGGRRALTHTSALTAATLKPPRPFAGTGTYAAAPDGTRSWTGNLSAAFPGAPRLQLAGPPFRARLSAGF